MKKFVFLLATGFFFCIMVLISGCEEPDPIVIPVEEISKATVFVSQDTIYGGEKATFSFNSKGYAIRYVTYNGKKDTLASNGDYISDELFVSTTFNFVFKNAKKDTVILKKIVVKYEIIIPPVYFKATVSVNPVNYGGKSVISWMQSNFKELSVGGHNGLLISSFTTPGLLSKTIYYIDGKGLDGSILHDSIIINVINPPTPDEELLCNYGPWKMIKLEFQNGPGLPWYEDAIWDCMKDDLLYFYLTPTKKAVYDRGEITCSPGEGRISEGPWFLIGNMLNTGDPNNLNEIIVLNQDTLVWVYHSGQTSTRETFIHP